MPPRRRTENDPGGLSMESSVLKLLADDQWRTATQVSKALRVRIDSVGGLLVKMCTEGKLRRENGRGPRGGHAYTLAPLVVRDHIPSWHDRLLQDDET